jgi:hypothetical protein
MLVTLVVVALLATIVAQALAQLARIERLLEGGQLDSMVDSVRAEWVRDTLAALLPGRVAERERLAGTTLGLTGLSADAPLLPAPGLARVRLRLVFEERTGVTALHYDDPSLEDRSSEPRSVVLLSWPGRSGRFRYLDHKGQWQDEWSSRNSGMRALPAAIVLETGLAALPMIVAAPRATETQLPTRRQLESM